MAIGPKKDKAEIRKKADEIFSKFNDSKMEGLIEAKRSDKKFVQISLRVEEAKLKQITRIGDMLGSGQSGGIRYAINKAIKEFEKSGNDIL